ncbi:putative subtilase family protein precursor [Panicum miliaceum]|uniref:Subtilase family protein n=1 Tax=Panicum miliaceum TaxID=4540 RepID=A0A3L6RBV6_PANMI|nr:putative subtilase family protein precursor [Panicum miliaceum]
MDEWRHILLSALALASIVISSTTPAFAFASGDAAAGAPGANAGSSSRRTYIVRVRAPPARISGETTHLDLESWYRTFLPTASSEEAAGGGPSALVHAYRAAMTGFAATLTEAEAAGVAARDDVLGVHPDRAATHTPDFLGLRAARCPGGHDHGAWDGPGRMGEGTVIGVIDSKVDLKHVSFRDDGMPATPPRWRGKCEEPAGDGGGVCNRKVVRVGYYTEPPPRPDEIRGVGHGTHVASTAAGNFVRGASVCGRRGCWNSDILAGMDAAIADGVDVISVSLHSGKERFHDDPVAVAAFSAMRKGIFVSCAGGNAGPQPSTLVNEAPWILTVGAGTIDRQMQAVVELGDGRTFVGESAYQPHSLPTTTALVYPPDNDNLLQANCWSDLNGTLVAGKIVACENFFSDGYGASYSVKEAGGVGVILLGPETRGRTTLAAAHLIASSYVAHPDSASIKKYINSTAKPIASIRFNGTALGTSPAPIVVHFSSRGPSKQSPGIVKPDIIGPGVNVIAAWPYKVGPSGELEDGGDNED